MVTKEFGIKIQVGGRAACRMEGAGNATTPFDVAVVVVPLLNKCPLSYVSGMIATAAAATAAAVCAILNIRRTDGQTAGWITEFAQRPKSEGAAIWIRGITFETETGFVRKIPPN